MARVAWGANCFTLSCLESSVLRVRPNATRLASGGVQRPQLSFLVDAPLGVGGASSSGFHRPACRSPRRRTKVGTNTFLFHPLLTQGRLTNRVSSPPTFPVGRSGVRYDKELIPASQTFGRGSGRDRASQGGDTPQDRIQAFRPSSNNLDVHTNSPSSPEPPTVLARPARRCSTSVKSPPQRPAPRFQRA